MLLRLGICVALLLSVIGVANAAGPNILIVLADDLGYGDLSCHGHAKIKSPTIDRFAKEGLRLTSCYAAHPNCSPSRTGMMTGRTPFRVGVYNWIPMLSPMHVGRDEITIATLLQQAGYDTCHVGKWHLNGKFNLPEQPQPSEHGFNHWFSTQNNALPNHRNPVNFVRGGKEVGPLEGYSAQLVAREGARWLLEGRDPEKPFFMFACFHEPHEPIASAKRFTDLYASPDPSLSAHHGNVTQLDDGFRILLDALESSGQRDDTFIFFTSDNGPAITSIHPHGSAGPLRDKKGAIYEGGIRVPGIVQWPGHVAGGTTSDQPVSGVDVLPTLCEIAGIKAPTDRALDGTSITPMFRGEAIQRKQPLYWQFNRAKSDVKVAIRDGNWKLVARQSLAAPNRGADITPEEIKQIKTAKLVDFELYNLATDIAESDNRINAQPQRFQSMKAAMQEIYSSVVAEAPEWPAWKWPRYESAKIQWPEYRYKKKQTAR